MRSRSVAAVVSALALALPASAMASGGNGQAQVGIQLAETAQTAQSQAEAEQHALAVLGAAVAARIDAATWAELRDHEGLNLPKEVAARFLLRLRDRVSAQT